MNVYFEKFCNQTNPEALTKLLYVMQSLQFTELETVSQQQNGISEPFVDKLYTYFKGTDYIALKVETVKFLKFYISTFGYQTIMDKFFMPQCLLDCCYQKQIMREILKLIHATV